MTRIGLFGGSFDPFTPAHMAIVDAVLDENVVDRVVVLPTIVDYHRVGKSRWLDDQDKLKVIHRFLTKSRNRDRILLDLTEINMKNSGMLDESRASEWRFIDTLLRVKKMYETSSRGEEFEFYTIVGTDSLDNLKTWSRWRDIVRESRLICVDGRDGRTPETDIPFIPVRIPDDLSSMSSSKMRAGFMDVDEYLNKMLGDKHD